MAGNLNLSTSVDTGQLTEGMNRAKAAVQDFTTTAGQAGGGLNQAASAAQNATNALQGTGQSAASVAQQFAQIGQEVTSGGFSNLPGAISAASQATGGLQGSLIAVAGAFGLAAAAASRYIGYLYRVRDAREAVRAAQVTFSPELDSGQVENLRKQLVEQSGISTEMSGQIASAFVRMQGVALPTMQFMAAAIKPVAAAMGQDIPSAAREMAQAMDQPTQKGMAFLAMTGASAAQIDKLNTAIANNSPMQARAVIAERLMEITRRQIEADGTAARRLEQLRAAELAASRTNAFGPNALQSRPMVAALERAAPATERYAAAVKALTNEERQAIGPSWMEAQETKLATLELATKQAARAEGLTRDQARERELNAQIKFWDSVLAGENLNAKQREEVTRRLLHAKEALEDAQMKPAKAGSGKAEREETAALMQEVRIRAQITNGEIATRKAELDEEVAAGRMSHAQATADFAEFVQAKRTLQLQALNETMALIPAETAAARALAGQKLEIEQGLVRQLAQLRAADARDAARRAQEQARMYEQAFSGIENSFKSSITGLISGTTTWMKATQSIVQSVISSFVDMGLKMVGRWLVTQLSMTKISSAATELRVANDVAAGGSGWGALLASWFGLEAGKNAATAAGVATRTAIVTTGAMTEKAVEKATALTSIGGDAAAAAAGAYKAVVGIPIIGPILAPAAAIAAFAAVTAFGGMIPSFDKGTMNVPQDMTARIHQGEMIVPAHIASAWRAGQAARGFGGIGGGGGSPPININYSVATNDTAWFGGAVKQHAREIARAVSREMTGNPTLRPRY